MAEEKQSDIHQKSEGNKVEHAPFIPEPETKRRFSVWTPNLIWLIPLIAALVGFSLLAKVFLERGPVIVISFLSAEGLEAGKTKVKYKNVDIGTVRSISLSDDHKRVLVTVQLIKQSGGFTASDTRFWVVRPRVAFSGVSGLDTLFSGTYIGVDEGISTTTAETFLGLETPPAITRELSGHQYVLHASDLGSLDIGSPIYYRRIKVGQVVAYNLDQNGDGVTLRAFIDAPYDRYVGMNSRFWHASGFDFHLDANGVKLNTQSLATILLGGIAFEAPEDLGEGKLAPENTEFVLSEDKDTALKEYGVGKSRTMVMYFKQSLRGLSPGAAVDFRGVVIGEVTSIGIMYDADRHEFRMPVIVHIYPERLGTDKQENEVERLQHLQSLIEHGLRAQLRTGNLLTGQLYVALDFFPKASKIHVDMTNTPAEFPTVPGSLDGLQMQLSEIASKINKIPFEELSHDLQKTLVTLNSTLTTTERLMQHVDKDMAPEMTLAIKDARKTLNAAEQTLSTHAPLQQDIRRAMQELTRTAGSLRVLTDYLEQHPEALIRGKQEKSHE